MSVRRTLGIAISCLLAGAALPAQTLQSAGVVLQTSNARLNANDAAIGTTIYDGDRLETQAKGALSLRSGQIELALAENSTVWMNHENSVAAPVLQRGTVTFRAETGGGVEVRADDVRVRPHNPVLTAGEVTLDDCNVYVTARTQQLEVTAGKETRILDEGKSFRVARRGVCAAAKNQPPQFPGQNRFWMAATGVGTGIVVWTVHEAMESPDRP
ncbi:MAG TPA: hypothetical protein VJN42_10120 [Candidatus Acidoferrum sp.]|nr:hypothetical protein [Candidatus Acidoferrum sp.]